MDFLGIGPLELIVVLVIALIVVGPERLPELARSVGKTMRDIRAMSQGLMTEWQREINSVAEVDPGEDLQKTLTQPFKEVQADFQQALRAPLTSPSETAGKLSPPEPSPPEESDSKGDNSDHGDN